MLALSDARVRFNRPAILLHCVGLVLDLGLGPLMLVDQDPHLPRHGKLRHHRYTAMRTSLPKRAPIPRLLRQGIALCALVGACSSGPSPHAGPAPDSGAPGAVLKAMQAAQRSPDLLQDPHAARFTAVPGWAPPVTLPVSYTSVLDQCPCQLGFVPGCREVCLFIAM